MKLRTWKYYIKQGFSGIAKNGLMSLASIIIVSACAFIVILSLCIATNINYMLEQVESKVGVTLFIGNKPTDAQVMELKEEIEKMPHVTSVKFKTAEEALDDYSKKTNLNFDSFKDDNPLPRSLEISLDDINSQGVFINSIEDLQMNFEKKIFGIKDEEETSTKATQNTTKAQATQNTTKAQATQNTTKAQATQATTKPQTQTVTQKAAEPSSQIATVAKVEAPAQPTTQAVQAKPQTASQPTTLAVKNEAEQPKAVSAQMPGIKTEATTAVVLTDGPVLGDADYKFQGIESIRHSQKLTEALITIDTVFKIVALVLIAILCVIAIGIIMNTIKLTVFIRKNEIGIMKYVGATDWFIRWPFIIEGVVIGIIGASIPVVLCWIGYLRLYIVFNNTNLLTALGHLREGNEIFMIIAPVTIGVGILLGAIGSINSIRKHLKV